MLRDWLGAGRRGGRTASPTGPTGRDADGRAVIRREAAIVGIGQTAYAKALPGTAWDLAIEAILAALADAGIDPGWTACAASRRRSSRSASRSWSARSASASCTFFAQAPLGGEALGAVIAHAAAAVNAGLASTVVVYRALSQSRGGRFGRADGRGPGGRAGAGR